MAHNQALKTPVRSSFQNGQQTHTQIIPSGEVDAYQVEIDFTDFRRGIYLLVFTQIDLDLDLIDYRIEY